VLVSSRANSPNTWRDILQLLFHVFRTNTLPLLMLGQLQPENHPTNEENVASSLADLGNWRTYYLSIPAVQHGQSQPQSYPSQQESLSPFMQRRTYGSVELYLIFVEQVSDTNVRAYVLSNLIGQTVKSSKRGQDPSGRQNSRNPKQLLADTTTWLLVEEPLLHLASDRYLGTAVYRWFSL
jgi:hypothetical protein